MKKNNLKDTKAEETIKDIETATVDDVKADAADGKNVNTTEDCGCGGTDSEKDQKETLTIDEAKKAPPVKKTRKYDFLYFLQLTFQSMKNNAAMSLTSMAVLMSCLIVMGSFFLVLLTLDTNLQNFGDLNQIVVYCDYDISVDQVSEIESKIGALSNVSSVDHVDKEEALKDMINEYGSYSDIFNDIEQNGDNPLSDSFVVKYVDNEYIGSLVYEISAIEGVRRVNNHADLSVKLENFKRGVIFVFVTFFGLLLMTSMFVIVNTIKLALHFRQYDIMVMKYVGATNVFILAPFILEGLIIGLISSTLGTVIQLILYLNILNAVQNALGMLQLISIGHSALIIWVAFFVVGMLCGLGGSIISIRKNLKA